MKDYVPYEERLRRAETEKQEQAKERASAQQAARGEIRSLLGALAGEGTNCYLELLEPVPRRYRGQKPVVRDHGLVAVGPCLIDEVVAAYRIPHAMHSARDKDGRVMVLDAFVTPDGRCWSFGSGTRSDAVYQPLKRNGNPVEATGNAANLERIIEGLRRIQSG